MLLQDWLQTFLALNSLRLSSLRIQTALGIAASAAVHANACATSTPLGAAPASCSKTQLCEAW